MKLTSLLHAVQQHVLPGMVLHFGSTPSRSNAAIVELVRQFRATNPEFTLCATGFHSTAHLLSLYRLGRRLVACFYGDNYPQPRPNALYQTLHDEGTVLEHWSLGNYVLALRAAAMGHPAAITRSLATTSLGPELTEHGRYVDLELPEQFGGSALERASGLIFPLLPDVSFLHAPVADERGHAWFCPPYSEGFYGALAARRGVILSVDRVLPTQSVLARPDLIPLPAHRVLAVCEAPFGAHPQPVHCGAGGDTFSYRDDFEAYAWWRRVTTDTALLQDFEQRVLSAEDSWSAYRAYIGDARLEGLRTSSNNPHRRVASERSPNRDELKLTESERVVVLAARYLVRRIAASQHKSDATEGLACMLAGIGQSFAAARLCKVLLADAGRDFELMVETGFTGFGEPGSLCDSYLLSQRNIALSTRLTHVESVLGTLVTGAANRCIGVIGGAEVDAAGNVNSTWSNGKLVVGSGGACDIALGAREVVVLARTERLVAQVEYITSPGARVRAIVIEHGVLERTPEGWQLLDLGLAPPVTAPVTPAGLDAIPWPNLVRDAIPTQASSAGHTLSADEHDFIQALRAEAASLVPEQRLPLERTAHVKGEQCTPSQ